MIFICHLPKIVENGLIILTNPLNAFCIAADESIEVRMIRTGAMEKRQIIVPQKKCPSGNGRLRPRSRRTADSNRRNI
jgi:hypothetical protein